MLLQPLVENAIKHGLEPKIEGGHVAVDARVEGEQLHITVEDSGRVRDVTEVAVQASIALLTHR